MGILLTGFFLAIGEHCLPLRDKDSGDCAFPMLNPFLISYLTMSALTVLNEGGSFTCMVLTVADACQAFFLTPRSFGAIGDLTPPTDRIPLLLNVNLSAAAGRGGC